MIKIESIMLFSSVKKKNRTGTRIYYSEYKVQQLERTRSKVQVMLSSDE